MSQSETTALSLACDRCHAPVGQRCSPKHPCWPRVYAAIQITREANRERREAAR